MTATASSTQETGGGPRGRAPATLALRFAGWGLIAAGAAIVLYLVYSLLFTSLQTNAAQAELLEEWEHSVAPVVEPLEPGPQDAPPVRGRAERPPADDARDLGAAVALLEFVRPGGDERPVSDEPLLVVPGTDRQALRQGPGHYGDTAMPGQPGNFAVAGHRTTYGAPFFHLDALQPGDEVHVTDQDGVTHVYTVLEQRVVPPDAAWVLGEDPLERDAALLTLTTCHPRFSARERLIVFAELAA